MQFTFLGTSAGLPTLHRNVSALALSIDNQRDWYLIDCGEGTQHRMLQGGFSSARLKAIFITHVHGDHSYGLPGLLATTNMSNRTDPLIICAPFGIEEFIKSIFHYTDVTLRYPIKFIRSDTPEFFYKDDHVTVESIELSHRVPSFAYRFEEQLKNYELNQEKLIRANVPAGPLWGELQRGKSVTLDNGQIISPEDICNNTPKKRSIIVGGDNDKPPLLLDAMKRSDVLIHEATFTESTLTKVGEKYQHSTAAAVGKSAQEAQIPHVILTHISQRYSDRTNKESHQLKNLYDEGKAFFDGNLVLAEDFSSFHLKRDGALSPIKN